MNVSFILSLFVAKVSKFNLHNTLELDLEDSEKLDYNYIESIYIAHPNNYIYKSKKPFYREPIYSTTLHARFRNSSSTVWHPTPPTTYVACNCSRQVLKKADVENGDDMEEEGWKRKEKQKTKAK